MTSTDDIEHRVNSLDSDISREEGLRENCGRELSAVSMEIKRLVFAKRYFQFTSWFRSPVATFDLWPVGVMICGPLLVASLFFAVAALVANSLSVAFFVGVTGALFGAVMFSVLLLFPKADTLQSSLCKVSDLLSQQCEKKKSIQVKYDTATNSLKSLQRDKAELVSSIQFQREQLMKKNWKAMRGDELENYLAEVCSALGYMVERTGQSGDQGVDLVVQRGTLRIAIQAKGYVNSVSNDAVQQVVAGMKVYNCNRCAVITNSRFTASAIELATINRCVLIGEESFEDFVMGRAAL